MVKSSWPWLTGGLLAVVLGGLWTLQGLNLLGGSVMSGVTLWAIIGPVVAIAGLILIVIGVRKRARQP
ncbi:MAG: hypothetical protein QOH97_2534 [Actinoplanes sp.]|jgi:hypothetical protein|nr:hypothetical protein [Actinoplanes sp.]